MSIHAFDYFGRAFTQCVSHTLETGRPMLEHLSRQGDCCAQMFLAGPKKYDAEFVSALRAIEQSRYAEALTKLLPLAEQADVCAQRMVGVFYLCFSAYDLRLAAQEAAPEVNAVIRGKAGPWLDLAAKAGDTEAQFLLGREYRQGHAGFEEDKDKSFALLLAAAQQDHAEAQSLVSAHYFEIGANDEAFRWCCRSAENGYALGQYTLGRLYADGERARRNRVLAYYWFSRAVLQNDWAFGSEFRGDRRALTREMSPQQLTRAKQLVNEYKRSIRQETETNEPITAVQGRNIG